MPAEKREVTVRVWRSRAERRDLWRRSRNPIFRRPDQSRAAFTASWRATWRAACVLPAAAARGLAPTKSDGNLRARSWQEMRKAGILTVPAEQILGIDPASDKP